jgi:hypothetical protein
LRVCQINILIGALKTSEFLPFVMITKIIELYFFGPVNEQKRIFICINLATGFVLPYCLYHQANVENIVENIK